MSYPPNWRQLNHYEYWQNPHDKQWWWHFVSSNAKIIARSSEGYERREGCLHSIAIMQNSASAPVVHVTAG